MSQMKPAKACVKNDHCINHWYTSCSVSISGTRVVLYQPLIQNELNNKKNTPRQCINL